MPFTLHTIDVETAIEQRDRFNLRVCLNCRNAKVIRVDKTIGPIVDCSKGRWPEPYRMGRVVMGKVKAMQLKGLCPDWQE